jgi:hypothetical protein
MPNEKSQRRGLNRSRLERKAGVSPSQPQSLFNKKLNRFTYIYTTLRPLLILPSELTYLILYQMDKYVYMYVCVCVRACACVCV